jgi:hypothetical protein
MVFYLFIFGLLIEMILQIFLQFNRYLDKSLENIFRYWWAVDWKIQFLQSKYDANRKVCHIFLCFDLLFPLPHSSKVRVVDCIIIKHTGFHSKWKSTLWIDNVRKTYQQKIQPIIKAKSKGTKRSKLIDHHYLESIKHPEPRIR